MTRCLDSLAKGWSGTLMGWVDATDFRSGRVQVEMDASGWSGGV